jgi:hypothetical protein
MFFYTNYIDKGICVVSSWKMNWNKIVIMREMCGKCCTTCITRKQIHVDSWRYIFCTFITYSTRGSCTISICFQCEINTTISFYVKHEKIIIFHLMPSLKSRWSLIHWNINIQGNENEMWLAKAYLSE